MQPKKSKGFKMRKLENEITAVFTASFSVGYTETERTRLEDKNSISVKFKDYGDTVVRQKEGIRMNGKSYSFDFDRSNCTFEEYRSMRAKYAA